MASQESGPDPRLGMRPTHMKPAPPHVKITKYGPASCLSASGNMITSQRLARVHNIPSHNGQKP